ncbi:hypothetical protein B0J12DRAFT_745589 [Macrophomina phaseolina]|uniref:Uncharacterized protein n=1 Tax=Macrophomina phaseolina TaxID=35725 RepID=A0ABQ8FUM8_9PEZI|nr:hypothetical protein B0J12DRAFT_745589 [Macrophomina phaseolina]
MGQKKRARMMTFGSLPMEPSETPEPQISACDSNATEQPCIAQNSEGLFKQVEQVDKGNESSPTRDLSTQAAILLAQQEFQQVFEPPSKDQPVFSPEIDTGSQRTRTSTPAPSQPPVAYTAVTPFKDFNKGRLFLDENPSQTEPVPTQELLNAASPFDFSTVKKNTNKRKTVSLAVSPLTFTEKQKAEGRKVEDQNIESNNGAESPTAIGTPTQGGLNGHTTADVKFADKSTTPSSPKHPTFVTDPQSSGLKPYSLNPTLSSAIKLKPSRFMAASRVSSQISSSFPRLGQPMSSAPQPTSSHALRQEYRRAQSQSRSQSQTQSQSQSSQQRSSQQLQPAQGRELAWDDVDVDSAIDAADSFLDTANLGLERGTPGR